MSLSIRADTLQQFPTPFQWTASSEFDGVDGSWSTFLINVGDNGEATTGQDFRILISTSASATFIPSGDVCLGRDDPDACNNARGIEVYQGGQSEGFQTDKSSSWQDVGLAGLSLDTTVDYGDGIGAFWGYDTVGLGRLSKESPMLTTQPVALLQARDNASYFMGMFGLSNIPLRFPTTSLATFMDNFFNASQIPSMSYGYGAGAIYGNDGSGVVGSLTLGGFDQSRFDSRNRAQIQMPGAGGENTSLIIGVQSITVDDGSGNAPEAAVQTGNGFGALIDSTLPYLWLPESVCDRLQEIYGLDYDEDQELYLVNSNNTEANAEKQMTLKISSTPTSSGEFVNIILPYAALSLTAKWPLTENETNYFAIKRSPNGQFVLGRAFLQEAYLIVDYERRNFTVARANMESPLPSPNIIPIISESLIENPNSDPNSDNNGGGGGLGPGAIAGIVVGVVTAIVIVLAVLFFRHRRNKKTQQDSGSDLCEKDADGFANPDAAAAAGIRPDTKRRASELEDPVWTRSSSAQGYYHRSSNSGSNMTELMGSPPLGSNEKNRDSYFGKFNPIADPAPLAELPANEGIAELDARSRPKGHRKRSGGSGSNLQSPRSERPDPIAEEHPDISTPGDGVASPMSEEFVTAVPTPADPATTAATNEPDTNTTAATTESEEKPAAAKPDEKDDKDKPTPST